MLASSKNLYISCGKDSKALYAKVNCAETEDAVTQKKAILVVNLAEYGTEIGRHLIVQIKKWHLLKLKFI